MKGITLGDVVLLVLLSAAVGLSFFYTILFGESGDTVLVELRGLAVYKGNLHEPRKVTVRGEYGDVRIVIADGEVSVQYAECPNKVCVRTGRRSRAGDVIVCVPNHLIVKILSKTNTGVRGVTG